MKSISYLTAILAVSVALLGGCVKGVQPSKPTIEGDPVSRLKASPGTADSSKGSAVQGKKVDEPPSPPGPDYRPPAPPGREKLAEASIDLAQKDEINEAAMRFAKEVPNVKHVKTCFSKLYGGWYLLLYVTKGKKVSLQQYAWNQNSKEWEIVYHLKELPPKELEFHLKGEVADEKCYVLK